MEGWTPPYSLNSWRARIAMRSTGSSMLRVGRGWEREGKRARTEPQRAIAYPNDVG
jgi:hypothetical protein